MKENLFYSESTVIQDDNPLKFLGLSENPYNMFEYRGITQYTEPIFEEDTNKKYASIYLRKSNSKRIY